MSVKLKGKRLTAVRNKLASIREAIETVQQDNFVKESMFELMEQVKEWCEELELEFYS